ncbi:hypothetical protein SGGMMB4_00846 [Sodalis glossinidius str. 'morsitans']|uniref:Uncharacterized protein n=1 Tax=Sodalis glossinidius (strain morsitans) TaxID=343509 RepID=A0A193QFP5_SODGM|nr:hypothetical protein SGGMMB4_00846 [Sodalis glossinidius str. 'morsitans']
MEKHQLYNYSSMNNDAFPIPAVGISPIMAGFRIHGKICVGLVNAFAEFLFINVPGRLRPSTSGTPHRVAPVLGPLRP